MPRGKTSVCQVRGPASPAKLSGKGPNVWAAPPYLPIAALASCSVLPFNALQVPAGT